MCIHFYFQVFIVEWKALSTAKQSQAWKGWLEKVFWDMRREKSPFHGACKITLGRHLSPKTDAKGESCWITAAHLVAKDVPGRGSSLTTPAKVLRGWKSSQRGNNQAERDPKRSFHLSESWWPYTRMGGMWDQHPALYSLRTIVSPATLYLHTRGIQSPKACKCRSLGVLIW